MSGTAEAIETWPCWRTIRLPAGPTRINCFKRSRASSATRAVLDDRSRSVRDQHLGGRDIAVDPSNPHLRAVLERAGLHAPSRELLGQLHVACADVEGYTDAILEVSEARWANETEGDDVLVVLMRGTLVLVAMRKRGIFSAVEPVARVVPLGAYRDVADDDEFASHTVWFLTPDEDRQFLLKWDDLGERDRMFRAIFAAHGGRYEQWGLRLDPANYVIDFDRYYAQLSSEGPDDPAALRDWIERRFGEFDLRNALGFALEWRQCVLYDETGREPSHRVGRLAFPMPWVETGPEARRVIVRLGEELFDEDLLGPPYDERTFHTGEPLSNNDAGPARLIALMTLAINAHALNHSRTSDWIAAATAGMPSVPPSVFPENLRTQWSRIASPAWCADGISASDEACRAR